MSSFAIRDEKLEGLKIITPFYAEDNRGYFLKNYEKNIFAQLGIEGSIYEEFETFSRRDVIRGLHFQLKEPQTKFVRVIYGSIVDIVVDLRKDSATYKKWQSIELSDKNHLGLYIPAGFAHGFLTSSKEAIVNYKCFGRYLPEYDSGIIWNDKTIAIDWQIESPILSERDKKLMTFEEYARNYGGGYKGNPEECSY